MMVCNKYAICKDLKFPHLECPINISSMLGAIYLTVYDKGMLHCKSIPEWARLIERHPKTIRNRILERHWTIRQALEMDKPPYKYDYKDDKPIAAFTKEEQERKYIPITDNVMMNIYLMYHPTNSEKRFM